MEKGRLLAVAAMSWALSGTPASGADSLIGKDGQAREGKLEFLGSNAARITGPAGETLQLDLAEIQSLRRSPSGAAVRPWMVGGVGVLTVNGTFIAQAVRSLDEKKVTFQQESAHLVLTTQNTAAVFFQALDARSATALRLERSGVLLRNGDFMEGECKVIENGKVTIESLLLGNRTFATGGEALAVFLRPPLAGASAISVLLPDGSRLRPTEFEIVEGGVRLHGSPFRDFRIGGDRAFEFQRKKARAYAELLEERWTTLDKNGAPHGPGKGGSPDERWEDDSQVRAFARAQSAAEERRKNLDAEVNRARQEGQRRQQIWTQRNAAASRARGNTARARGQVRSKEGQLNGLEHAVAAAQRDWDRKKGRVETARKSWEEARAQLARAGANQEEKRRAEAKVRTAERARQNAKRIADQGKATHARAMGRLKSMERVSKAAADQESRMKRAEEQAQRELERATAERDAAKKSLAGATADLARIDDELRRIAARLEERRQVLRAGDPAR